MSTISSDSEDEHSLDSISDNEIIETPAQKRLRLAKAYIQKLDDSKLDVLDTLNQDYSNLQGSRVEDTNYSQSNLDRILKFPKKLVIQSSTAACAISTPSSVLVYAVSKDASIVSWDLLNNVRKIIKGELKQTKKRKKRCFKKPNENIHSDQLLTVASSSDGLFLATSGRDKTIKIWSPSTNKLIATLKHHRDAITGLKFQINSHTLFSASLDRSVKVWSISDSSCMYIETLFGHQDSITDIDALSNQVCVTSGGRDKTVRNWKIEDESQLIFNAKDLGGNVDSIACVSDSLFVSGSDSGSISLWETGKKKPLFTKTFTHGKGTHESIINDEIISVGYCNWITSLASLPNTDLFASGSCDGKIRFYKISKDRKSFTELFQQDANGFVNSLSFFKKDDQVFLVACLGMEHKMGRWWRVKDAKNCVVVYKLG